MKWVKRGDWREKKISRKEVVEAPGSTLFHEGGEEQAALGLFLASLSFSLSRAMPRPANTLNFSSFFLAFFDFIPGSGCKMTCLSITNS